MGKPRIPSFLLSALALLPVAGLFLRCRRPVEVKKGDYLLHATPESLPKPAPVPPPKPADPPDPEDHPE